MSTFHALLAQEVDVSFLSMAIMIQSAGGLVAEKENKGSSLAMQLGFLQMVVVTWELWYSDYCVSIDGPHLDMDCMCIASCKWNSLYRS